MSRQASFDQWFASSKVVDSNHQPLIVFHGTRASFVDFDRDKLGASTGHRTSKMGFFFSSDAEVAASFSGEKWEGWPLTKGFSEGANVMPIYLSVQQPYVMGARDFMRRFVREIDNVEDFMRTVQKEGHDGIRITGDKALAEAMGGEEYGADAWVVFRPEQIKSAIISGPDCHLRRIAHEDRQMKLAQNARHYLESLSDPKVTARAMRLIKNKIQLF